MLILSSTYRQALSEAGLDPETFPIKQDASWNSETLTFDNSLAELSFSDMDFTAVSNLNKNLGAATKSDAFNKVNISQVKENITTISSTHNNLVSLQSKNSDIKSLVVGSQTNVQTGTYTNSVISDTSTAVDVQSTGYQTSVDSDVSNQLDIEVVSKTASEKVDSKDTEVKSKSYVITLR